MCFNTLRGWPKSKLDFTQWAPFGSILTAVRGIDQLILRTTSAWYLRVPFATVFVVFFRISIWSESAPRFCCRKWYSSNRFEKNWFPNVSRCGTKEDVRSQGEASSGSSRNLNASFKSPSKIHLVELMMKLVGYLTPYKSGTRTVRLFHQSRSGTFCHTRIFIFFFATLHSLFRCPLQPNRHSVEHISRYLSDRYSSIRTSIFQPFLPHIKR